MRQTLDVRITCRCIWFWAEQVSMQRNRWLCSAVFYGQGFSICRSGHQWTRCLLNTPSILLRHTHVFKSPGNANSYAPVGVGGVYAFHFSVYFLYWYRSRNNDVKSFIPWLYYFLPDKAASWAGSGEPINSLFVCSSKVINCSGQIRWMYGFKGGLSWVVQWGGRPGFH